MTEISWHNWVKQEKSGEWEKGNQGWMGTPKRELWRRKGSHTLESHLLNGKIYWIGGISRFREEHGSKSEVWRAEWEWNRSSELLGQSPKTEMLGWGLGTETLAPEVSPQEQAGVGSAENGWGTRKWPVRLAGQRLPQGTSKWSVGLAGQRLPGRLESRESQVEVAIH